LTGTLLTFCIDVVLVLVLGMIWLRKKSVWRDFWAAPRSADVPEGTQNSIRPWSDSAV
jgi:hypothetical protein